MQPRGTRGHTHPLSKTLNYCKRFCLQANLQLSRHDGSPLAKDSVSALTPKGEGVQIIGVFGVGSGEALFAKRASPVTLQKTLELLQPPLLFPPGLAAACCLFSHGFPCRRGEKRLRPTVNHPHEHFERDGEGYLVRLQKFAV